jgi:hypothetical protein
MQGPRAQLPLSRSDSDSGCARSRDRSQKLSLCIAASHVSSCRSVGVSSTAMPSLIEYEEALRAAIDRMGAAQRAELALHARPPSVRAGRAHPDVVVEPEDARAGRDREWIASRVAASTRSL